MHPRPAAGLASLALLAAALPLVTAAPGQAADTNCTSPTETSPNTNSTYSTDSIDSAARSGEHASPDATGIVTLITAPGAVRNLTVAAGDASASVSWDPPTDLGGLQLLPYYLTVGEPFAEYTTSATGTGRQGCTITGLTNGVTYTVSVAARNAKGLGPAVQMPFTPQVPVPVAPEPPVVQQPPAGTPSPVVKAKKAKKATVRLSAGRHRGGNRLTVRWKARHTGHVRLTWRRGAGKPHSQRTSPSGRITLAGPPGTRYTIRVQAGTAADRATYRIP